MSALNPNRLLHTKLMPPRLPAVVLPRETLLARLDAGLTRKVSLVSAPTGFGKTTLVRMWLASRDARFAWVTLDDHDSDPVRFWTYVCSALRMLDPGVGKASLSMLASPQPPSFASLLTPLINDLGRWQAHSVLVLEDYHAIQSAEIHEGVAFLVQHLPETLHLVFIARTDPDLPLAILRVRQELVEVHASDLRFDTEEIQTFLDTTVKTRLPSAAVSMLSQKTEGWPAGLRLLSMALQNRSNAEIEALIDSFSGSDRYVADYLIKEVFERQPEATRSFLLKTSFFARLTGSLCDALLEEKNSAALLEQLERENLFLVQLERKGDRVWYRYNPLFAESLQYLARQQFDEGSIQALFENASAWYDYHGLLDEAIETALAANLFERAMTLIEKFIEIHNLSELRTIGRWLDVLPQPRMLEHPIICFTYAQVLLYSTDRFAPATAARIEPFLRAAETAWQENEDHQRLGQVLSFRGNVTWWQGDFERAFAYSRQALPLLAEHDVFWRGISLLSLCYEALNAGRILEAQDLAIEARALLGAAQNIYGVLAAVQFLAEIFHSQGELEQAEQLNRQILTEAIGEESMLDDQGIASRNLAAIAYERNDLSEAEALAARALELAERRANEMLRVQASIQLAQIYTAKEDSTHSSELLKSVEARVQNPVLLRELQQAQALLSIRRKETASLGWWVNLVSSPEQTTFPLQKERDAFTLARLRIAEGNTDAALSLLKPWLEEAARHGRVRSQVEGLSLQALAYHAGGDLSMAAPSLREALALGESKSFRRIFLDEGGRMAALLQTALPALASRSLQLFASTLLHAFPPEMISMSTSDSTVPVESLSAQELRVLRLLAAGLSNVDIARELVVSTNTIKTHVKSIYRKLSVNSRSEAREVARELRLV